MTSPRPSAKFRVAYLVSHPIQYQAPLLQTLVARSEIALHARMGARSREIVAAFSYEADIEGVLEALRRVVAGRRLGKAS